MLDYVQIKIPHNNIMSKLTKTNIDLVDYVGIFLHFPKLLTDDCSTEITVKLIVV